MSVLVALVLPAFAQESVPTQEGGFDAHGFRFASADADLRAPLGFVRPGNEQGASAAVAAVFEYASRPLVFDPGTGPETVALENLIAANLAARIVPLSAVRIDFSLPVFLASGSDLATHEAAPGDLRASLLAAFSQPGNDGGFGLGVLGALDAPTGDPATFRGTDGWAGLVALSGTVEGGGVTGGFLVGGRFAPQTQADERPAPTRGGDTLEAALSLGGRAGAHVGLGLEGHLSLPLDPSVRTAIGTPADVLASMRYVSDSGGHVLAGVGAGLGQGAGASPIRLVVGGGFGGGAAAATAADSVAKDGDADGIPDRRDACPDGAETLNGYLDEDACPDVLPQVEVVAVLGGQDLPEAKVAITSGSGEVLEGTGRHTVSGVPGGAVDVLVTAGACRSGEGHAKFPSQGTTVLKVPVVVRTGKVTVSVSDAAGRPLDTGMVRYLADDPACSPDDTTLHGGRGTHQVGVGHVTLLVTAPGYDVQQLELDVDSAEEDTVAVELHPTQVSVRGTQLVLAEPIQFLPGSAIVDEVSTALLQQVATTMFVHDLKLVRVSAWGEGADARRLAEGRAEAVVAFLVSLGIPSNRLTIAVQGTLPRGQADRIRFALK